LLAPNEATGKATSEGSKMRSEAYCYTRAGQILMRSQLDCYSPHIPRDRKTFDIKTRATLPIRMDIGNYKCHLGYRLHSALGLYNSFEREYYDMCRSAMLKYK